MQLEWEVAFEIDMTKEKLREMIRMVENAEKTVVHGQVLRIKINHTHQFVFKNLTKNPVAQGVTIETPVSPVH